jgi:SNF2 family DNA or RNA helicase
MHGQKMFYSAQHKCLVYEVPHPQQVVAAIAGARAINGSMVSIPITVFNMQLARILGLPVPNMLDLKGYDWPSQPGRKPYAHQKHMAAFHVCSPRSFNLSEMGVGKTAAVLWAADFLMREGLIHKVLILAPLSTLKRVWDDEIFMAFCNARKATILHGTREDRVAKLQKDCAFYILNHDGLGIGSRRTHHKLELGPLAAKIRDRNDIDMVIIDEASAYKDGATQRTRILRQVVEHKPYVVLMSGTPTPNAPTDAWSLARLAGNLMAESYNSFRGRTMAQVSQFKWLPRAGSAEIVRKALSPAIRYSREECIDLPECVVETRDVELSPTQAAAYKNLKKDLRVTLGEGKTVTAVNEAVLRMKLIQISGGAIYGPDKEIYKTDCGPRLKVLQEVVDEAGAKVLVFASLTSVVNLVFSELAAVYGQNAVAKVYGDTGHGRRSEIFRAFEQDAEPRIIVADPGTMAHGLTLVKANTIVWFTPTDKGELYDQANARINRPGQVNRMLIVRLASTPVEREVYRRLAEKESMQGAVLKLAEDDR